MSDTVTPQDRGPARDVLDYIAWIDHCEWVNRLYVWPSVAMASFPSFHVSASAERGRSVSRG